MALARPSQPIVVPAPLAPAAIVRERPPSFEQAYEQHFDFVWRSLGRLGVPHEAAEDAAQEVFLVVHRNLGGFEGRSAFTTWLFAIVLNVARRYRRTVRRKGAGDARRTATEDPELLTDGVSLRPDESAARAEAVRTLYRLLDELDDERREVFVMAELEQLAVPAIAEALSANVHTVYSRLRAARQDFEQAVARHRARAAWRSP